MTRVYDILNILRTFIEPRCELNYRNSYELLIAVVLSAQTTDKHVNQITIPLFEKYDDVFKLSKADVSSIKEIINKTIFTIIFETPIPFTPSFADTLKFETKNVSSTTHIISFNAVK